MGFTMLKAVDAKYTPKTAEECFVINDSRIFLLYAMQEIKHTEKQKIH